MKKTLIWSAVTAAIGAGAVFGYRWWQRARVSVASGLEQAERVTAATRQTLQQTEQALRQTRTALQ
jgi:predicted negative regulator of RcsB-dependent stress response